MTTTETTTNEVPNQAALVAQRQFCHAMIDATDDLRAMIALLNGAQPPLTTIAELMREPPKKGNGKKRGPYTGPSLRKWMTKVLDEGAFRGTPDEITTLVEQHPVAHKIMGRDHDVNHSQVRDILVKNSNTYKSYGDGTYSLVKTFMSHAPIKSDGATK